MKYLSSGGATLVSYVDIHTHHKAFLAISCIPSVTPEYCIIRLSFIFLAHIYLVIPQYM